MSPPKTLTIFEGPDGGGKTTAAKEFAQKTDAEYHHCLEWKDDSGAQLAHRYTMAMGSATMGRRNVVMDRCWISEEPYGIAYRDGAYRLWGLRHGLDTIALSCSPLIIICLPPWETVRKNYMARKETEMLDNEHQLMSVYGYYERLTFTGRLKTIRYDYTKGPFVTPERGV